MSETLAKDSVYCPEFINVSSQAADVVTVEDKFGLRVVPQDLISNRSHVDDEEVSS